MLRAAAILVALEASRGKTYSLAQVYRALRPEATWRRFRPRGQCTPSLRATPATSSCRASCPRERPGLPSSSDLRSISRSPSVSRSSSEERTFGKSSFSSSFTWCLTYSGQHLHAGVVQRIGWRRGFEPADDVLERLMLHGGFGDEVPDFLVQVADGGVEDLFLDRRVHRQHLADLRGELAASAPASCLPCRIRIA